MLFSNWLVMLKNRRFRLSTSHRRRSAVTGYRSRKEFAPAAELLEDRTLLSPDLVVLDLWTEPSSVIQGQSYKIKAQIKNQGNTTADAGWFANQEALFYVDGVKYGEGDDYDNLAAGATLTVESITLTGPSAGTHTIKVKADGNNEVSESNESNNERSESITVNAPPKPDLIVQDISISPSSPIEDQSATITATLKNQGDADASGSIQLKYYVDGSYIGSDNMSFGLGAGKSDTESISYTASTSGNHTVKVIVDTSGIVSESNENNNERSETYYWNPPPKPDLIVQDISISPSSPIEDQSATITATLKNQGDADASGSIELKYYVDGSYIGSDNMSFGLGAGKSDTESISYTSSTSGNHTVKVIVDTSGIVSESNENNNERSETYYWNPPPKPDLAVFSVELDETATTWYVGDDIDAKVTVKNIGTATAQDSRVHYYLGTSTNKTLQPIGEGWLGGVYPLNDMSAGEQDEDWIGSSLPGGGWEIPNTVATPGTYYIWAQATTTSQDSNSTNDWEKSSAFTIDVRVPDLDVLSVELDETATTWYVGDDIDAKVTVKNIGTATAQDSRVHYYLGTSTNKTLQPIGEGWLGGVYPLNDMSAGEQDEDWIGSSLPGGGWEIPNTVATPGTYYIWAQATTTSQDSNSTNDWEKSSAFTIDVRVPDLDVLSVELDETATTWYVGDDIDAKVTVKNIGTATAQDSRVHYYLGTSTNKTLQPIGEGWLGGVYPLNDMSAGEQDEDWIGSSLPGGGWEIPNTVATPGTYYIWAQATTTSDDPNGGNDWEKSSPFEIEDVFSPTITDVRRSDVDTDGDGYAHEFTLQIDVYSKVAGQAYFKLYEDDPWFFWLPTDDPIAIPHQDLNIDVGTNTFSITVNTDDHSELKTRGTAEFKLELIEIGTDRVLDTKDEDEDSDLGNVKVELSCHEKDVREELSWSFSQLIDQGLDWWHEEFGGKPVFGLSLGTGLDNWADWAELLAAPETGGISLLLEALNTDIGAGVDLYFDIGDFLGLSQDGHDGWITLWLGADLFGNLGFEVPFTDASSPVKVGFGLETFQTESPEYDPQWDFLSETKFSANFLSANAGGNKWYAGQFGWSGDNGFGWDWLGEDLGNFTMNLSLDLLDLNLETSITSFELKRDVFLAAISPLGFDLNNLITGLFEGNGASFGPATMVVPYAEMLTAGADEDYSQSWIRSVTPDEMNPAPIEVEVGSAVFRDGVLGGLEWHAGLFWLYDGYADERVVLQANGVGETLSGKTWDEFLGTGEYRGARELDGYDLSLDQRNGLSYEGLWQVNADYSVTTIRQPNSSWQSGDGQFRCDSFVEYVYDAEIGEDFHGVAGLQTPRATYYALNAVAPTITAPTITSASYGGSTTGSITIEFSELMSRGTLDPASANTVSLVGSIGGNYEFDATFASDLVRDDLFYWDGRYHDAKRMTLTPRTPFQVGETLTLTIGTGAKDLGGNSLGAPYTSESWPVLGGVPPTAQIDSIAPTTAQPPDATINLAGTGSDTDGSVVAWQWTSNLDGVLSNNEDFSRSSNNLTVGTHQISFRVQDDDGLWSDPDVQNVVILDAAPTAEFRGVPTDPVTAGSSFTVTLGGHDNDENDQSVAAGELTLISGSEVIRTVAALASHEVTVPSEAGPYTLSYRVRDDEGSWSPPVTASFTVSRSLADIGDFVWEDTDKDGIQDTGEEGLAGVTVRLKNSSGQVVETTTTGSDDDEKGKYLFSDVTAGTYTIEVTAPSGYTFTQADQGGDETKDSDANAQGIIGPFEFSGTADDLSRDVGLVSIGKQQIVTGQDRTAPAGSEIVVPVSYTTSDQDNTLSGLAVRMFYDERFLTYNSLDNVVQLGLQPVQVRDDTQNLDNDDATNKYVFVAWAPGGETWPGETLPTHLFDARFTVNEGLTDGTTATVRFTGDSVVGYAFSGTPFNVTVGEALCLDVDLSGGEPKALNDGLLILRYLWDYTGDELTRGIVDPNGGRTDPVEIVNYLDQFRTLLDVDLSGGEPKALNDGLLILRYLWDYTGNELTRGIVDPNGERTGPDEIITYLDRFRTCSGGASQPLYASGVSSAVPDEAQSADEIATSQAGVVAATVPSNASSAQRHTIDLVTKLSPIASPYDPANWDWAPDVDSATLDGDDSREVSIGDEDEQTVESAVAATVGVGSGSLTDAFEQFDSWACNLP